MNYEQMNNNKLQLIGTVVKKPIYSHEVFGEGRIIYQSLYPKDFWQDILSRSAIGLMW